jgi:hypothetical protein
MQLAAQKIFEQFIAGKPSDSELELAALFYAAWCHEHCRDRPEAWS